MNKVLHGDCLEVLKTIEDNTVDSIVTDPPYELGFMGKSWDNTGIANNPVMWAECLRVLKPGGHLLSFGGTRTYHRMASAIEDAGFEVRDMIEWIYGSGFPKSLNIGKAVDKLQGNEREVSRVRTDGSGNATSENNMYDADHKFVATKVFNETKGTSEWEGWGTALKPAHEPICMARKPLAEKTVAENVLKYGTGGINIDESRVAANWKEERPESWFNSGKSKSGNPTYDGNLKSLTESTVGERLNDAGRFPANLIHDNSEEVRGCFPENKSTMGKTRSGGRSGGIMGNPVERSDKDEPFGFNDSGNASRFFKSIKKDLQYSPKHAILKLCENNISVNNAENNLKTTSQIELVANIFSALKSATPNLDLLNQNLNALFVEKSADSTEIDFVAKCVAIKELPEELVSQQEYTVFQDFMEDYKKCSLTQNPVSAEKLGNTDITQIMTSLLKLSGYVLAVIEENISSENQEGQKCDYRSLVYIPKASKSERTAQGTISNSHPTIKPIALMEYLIKMITPTGGTVLDPFAGSGSTLVVAKQNGFNYIGIEMTAEYIPIIEARLSSIEYLQSKENVV